MIGTTKKILFSWSGGGLPGLDIHVGIWKALEEAGIESSFNAGTSAGSLIGAFNSNGCSAAETEAVLRGLSDKDVRAPRALWKLRMFWLDYFLKSKPIRRLIDKHLPFLFDDLKKPLNVFVTDNVRGASVILNCGVLARALLTSMSISGVFQPQHDRFSDGGTTANIPLPDNWVDFDEVYLLVAARPISYKKTHGILTRVLYNMDLLMENQVQDTIEMVKCKHDNVHVFRPPVRAMKGSLHFDHDLIDEAYEFTAAQLKRRKLDADV